LDTNHSRGVWSWREGSKELVGCALESTELGAAFKCAKDKFFRGVKPKDAAVGGCVEGASIEDLCGRIREPRVSWSRLLMLVTGK